MSNIEFKTAFSRYNLGVEANFTTAIALVAGNSYSKPVTVEGPIALTIAASPVPGAEYQAYFIADGANEPGIAGAYEHDSSTGYDNSAGTANILKVWHDGVSVLYAWSHLLDVSPVLLTGAEIQGDDRTELVLTFSGGIDEESVPDAADFTLTNSAGIDSITDVAISGSDVTLTRTRDEDDSTITISYERGDHPLKAAATGFDIAEFAEVAVSFAEAEEPEEPEDGMTLVRLPHLDEIYHLVTETANGDGWDYAVLTDAHAPYYVRNFARSSLALQANEDGAFAFTVGSGDMAVGPSVGFTTDPDADWYASDFATAAVQINDLGHYGVLDGAGAPTTPDSLTSEPAIGDVIKIERAGTELIFSLSTNDGASFTEFHRETGLSTAALYIFAQFGNTGSKIILPRVSGEWA